MYFLDRMHFNLVDDWGYPIPQEELYVPHFRTNCETCGSRLICNGCSNCGKWANACDRSKAKAIPSVQTRISLSGYLRGGDLLFYQSFVVHRPCRLQ